MRQFKPAWRRGKNGVSVEVRPRHAVTQRILLIDDSPLVRDVLETVLDDEVVIEDRSDLTGVGVQELAGFDLILVDIHMRGRSGDSFAAAMRGELLRAPIVLMSSLAEPELAARARESGADGYICKAAGPHGIARAIHGWLERGRT